VRLRLVGHLDLPTATHLFLSSGRQELTEELPEHRMGHRRHGQALERSLREHLRLAIRTETELVGSLMNDDRENGVDPGHVRVQRSMRPSDSILGFLHAVVVAPSLLSRCSRQSRRETDAGCRPPVSDARTQSLRGVGKNSRVV
jgi:hypothetical protein